MRLPWKPPEVFYGWWIVFACFIIALYMSGVVFYGFTAIFEPIADEFGWSYTEISIAASIRGLEAGLLAPFVGLLVDRNDIQNSISRIGYLDPHITASIAVFRPPQVDVHITHAVHESFKVIGGS